MRRPTSLPRVIFLDFDGVILESNELKTKIYQDLFCDHPGRLEEILALHRARAGLPRRSTLRLICEEILHEPTDSRTLQALLARFEELVRSGLAACREVEGLCELLSRYPAKFYVVSGAPQREVREALIERDLARRFSGIFGAPHRKRSVIRSVLMIDCTQAEDAVFVGDSANDRDAAISVGVPFVARATEDNQLVSSVGWPVIRTLRDLVDHFEAMVS